MSGLLRAILAAALVAATVCSNEFRSYHPQYLHSYSYAQPSTLHLYYGRVVGNRPVFLIKDAFEDDSEQIYHVNGEQQLLPPKKPTNLQTEVDLKTQSRSIMVFALEDSFDSPRVEHSRLHVLRTRWGFFVALVNQTHSRLYEVHVTKDDKLIKHSEYASNHLQISCRNVGDDPKENWRISRRLEWQTDVNDETDQIEEFAPGHLTIFGDVVTNPTDNQQPQHYKPNMPKFVVTHALKAFTAVAFQVSVPLDELYQFGIHINEVKNFSGEPIMQRFAELAPNVEKDIEDELKQERKEQSRDPPTCESRAVELLFRGLSFEYGRIRVVQGNTIIPNEPRELLSFSPSRKRFPWGFLWDDGFHNEVASRIEPQTSLKVIKSWLDTMIDGWIPREQDRGTERVELCNCQRFLAKDIRDGNPPSLVLPLAYLLRTGYLTKDTLGEKYWGKLKEWYDWFMRTQMVGADSFLFKWFDHIESEGSFNSGMDDFPRPPGTQYHVDAQAWMYELTKFMVQASQVFEPEAAIAYQENLGKIKDGLQIFLQPTKSIYLDVIQRPDGSRDWSPHIGYGALLPLAFGMIDVRSPQFKTSLNLIIDETMLNTKHGLSSIARSSAEYYRSPDAYWRGPIWINMNYAVLRGLKLYYPEETVSVYNGLRNQVLSTVCGEWEKKGYFFENYKEGAGTFSYPFNGWTSLIAVVISEKY